MGTKIKEDKLIYIIRHAQTDYNNKNIVQGSGVDSDINEKGRRQAKHFFLKYKNLGFDKVYVSSLKRSMQSVEHFLYSGIPYESLDLLNELNWGIYENKIITPEILVEIEKLKKQWKCGNLSMAPLYGESPEQVVCRLQKALNYILSKTDEAKVLICTHKRVFRILLCMITNLPLSKMNSFKIQNFSLYSFQYLSLSKSFTMKTNNEMLSEDLL
ncbi:MAG: histidine phosphatase family protein [Spirochaetota bacterium]